jgi:hypothetical protein
MEEVRAIRFKRGKFVEGSDGSRQKGGRIGRRSG